MQSSSRNTMCIVCLIICVALWFFAPFVAINILTMGDQPSALDFITDNITYIGELTEAPPFWASVGSLIGIVVCLFCAVAKKGFAVRVVAIITELPLFWVMFEMFRWADGNMDDFFEMFGFGYWCILVLLLIVIVLSGKGTEMATKEPPLSGE